MKTRTPLQRTGLALGVILSIIVALIPTGIYAAVWWFIPKTFWPIVWTTLGGILLWLPAQIVTSISIIMWWYDDESEWDEQDWDSYPQGTDNWP